jgi:hypothetical protein
LKAHKSGRGASQGAERDAQAAQGQAGPHRDTKEANRVLAESFLVAVLGRWLVAGAEQRRRQQHRERLLRQRPAQVHLVHFVDHLVECLVRRQSAAAAAAVQAATNATAGRQAAVLVAERLFGDKRKISERPEPEPGQGGQVARDRRLALLLGLVHSSVLHGLHRQRPPQSEGHVDHKLVGGLLAVLERQPHEHRKHDEHHQHATRKHAHALSKSQ